MIDCSEYRTIIYLILAILLATWYFDIFNLYPIPGPPTDPIERLLYSEQFEIQFKFDQKCIGIMWVTFLLIALCLFILTIYKKHINGSK